MPRTEPSTVSVVIPTLNRHRALARALSSVVAQSLPPDLRAEVVVVDNSLDGNARPVVEAASAGSSLPIRYVAMPRPGIATARNAGIAAASGEWIAFLDDDETGGRDWLAALVGMARHGGFDAVFGPVSARAEEGDEIGAFADYFARGVVASDGADITRYSAYLGTNNSLFAAALCRVPGGPFEERLNSIGGEDSLFLHRLAREGKRFGWSEAAKVTEWVPRRRLDWAYVRRRRFLSGQIRTFVHDMSSPRSRPRGPLDGGRRGADRHLRHALARPEALQPARRAPPPDRGLRRPRQGAVDAPLPGSLYGTGLVS